MKNEELDKRFSYNLKAPIRTNTEGLFLSTDPIDEDWKEAISLKWWATNYKGELSPSQRYYFHLRDKLLSFGGEEVCLEFGDKDYNNIFHRGQLWLPSRVQIEKGERSHCHQNSAYLWKANQDKEITIVTGYALSKDGMWRQHSWCVLRKSRSTVIIETTEPRIAYYGFVMNPKECEDFFSDVTY